MRPRLRHGGRRPRRNPLGSGLYGIGGSLVRHWRAKLRGEGQLVSRREVWRRIQNIWAHARAASRLRALGTVRDMARDYYSKPGNEVGGLCHVVLDDDNLDDRSLNFCAELCADEGDADGVDLMIALLSIPDEDERRSALGPYPFCS